MSARRPPRRVPVAALLLVALVGAVAVSGCTAGASSGTAVGQGPASSAPDVASSAATPTDTAVPTDSPTDSPTKVAPASGTPSPSVTASPRTTTPRPTTVAARTTPVASRSPRASVKASVTASARAQASPTKPATGAAALTIVRAALDAMSGRGQYRMIMTARKGNDVTTLTQDVQVPGRTHTTVRAPSGTLEFVTVGPRTWMRVDGGAWGVSTGSAPDPGAPADQDLQSARQESDDAAGNRRFEYFRTGGQGQGEITLDRLGRVIRVIMVMSEGTVVLQVAYLKITVEPPV